MGNRNSPVTMMSCALKWLYVNRSFTGSVILIFMPGQGPPGSLYSVYPLSNSTNMPNKFVYSTNIYPHSANPPTFSPIHMLMTSLLSVPTPTLMRWLRPLSEVWPVRFVKLSLAICAPKSTITIFNPQSAQSQQLPTIVWFVIRFG